ncbi:MAG: hypothetical protein MUO35_10385 [Anaerolineales bacterium]|nr:hypothetical protein [Anaerolineales bacterium]
MPYSFPTGRELLLLTCEMLSGGNPELLSLFRQLEIPSEVPGSFAVLLKQSFQPSVDAFVENRPEFLQIGKAAIAAALIPHENQRRLEHRKAEMQWYEYLFHQLGPTVADFESSNLTVVTYNYDRSLEYFLYNALARAFGLDAQRTDILYSRVPIIHLHGQLGTPHFISSEGRTYSPTLDLESLRIAVSSIHIPQAEKVDQTPFELASDAINEAEVLCFLGFAYLPQNVRRLRIHMVEGREIYGCTYHLPRNDVARAQRNIPSPATFGTFDQDALAFLQDHPIFE